MQRGGQDVRFAEGVGLLEGRIGNEHGLVGAHGQRRVQRHGVEIADEKYLPSPYLFFLDGINLEYVRRYLGINDLFEANDYMHFFSSFRHYSGCHSELRMAHSRHSLCKKQSTCHCEERQRRSNPPMVTPLTYVS
jgi:hypothetical protein